MNLTIFGNQSIFLIKIHVTDLKQTSPSIRILLYHQAFINIFLVNISKIGDSSKFPLSEFYTVQQQSSNFNSLLYILIKHIIIITAT